MIATTRLDRLRGRGLFACLVVLSCLLASCKRGSSSGEAGPGGTSTATTGGATPTSLKNDVAFTGTYTRYAVTTFKNGKRVQSTNNAGTSTLSVGGGKVIWAQTYPEKGKTTTVTQTYSYSPGDARPVDSGFNLPLTWLSIQGDTQGYSPDKNSPKVQARKQAGGWQLGLLTTDNNGVTGGAEFK